MSGAFSGLGEGFIANERDSSQVTLWISRTQGGTRWTLAGRGEMVNRGGVGADVSYRFSFLSRRAVHGRRDFHFHAGAVGEVLICGRTNTHSLTPE